MNPKQENQEHQHRTSCVLCGRPYLWEQMWKCHESPQPASVHGIVHGTLGYRNVSGYWDQNQLRENHLQMHMGLYLLCLMWYESTSGALLVQITAFEETWLHLCTLETEMYSLIQKHKHSPIKKFRTVNSAQNYRLSHLGCQRCYVAGTHLIGETVSTFCFYATLNRLSRS
jgi:hypothetical protein